MACQRGLTAVALSAALVCRSVPAWAEAAAMESLFSAWSGSLSASSLDGHALAHTASAGFDGGARELPSLSVREGGPARNPIPNLVGPSRRSSRAQDKKPPSEFERARRSYPYYVPYEGSGPTQFNLGDRLWRGLLSLLLAPLNLLLTAAFGAFEAVKGFLSFPYHMAKGLAAGKIGSLLDPLKAPLDLAWNAFVLGLTGANIALTPAWSLFDPQEAAVMTHYSQGIVLNQGGPAGRIISAVNGGYYPTFLAAPAAAFVSRSHWENAPGHTIKPSRNRPDHLANYNSGMVAHEVAHKEEYPVGFLTDFAVPWLFSPSTRSEMEKRAENKRESLVETLFPIP